MLSTANGPFLYSQTAHTDLNGSIWDTPIEGAQDFHGEEELQFSSYGHITPRGQDQNEAIDDMTSKWIVADQAMPVVAEPMKRISSRASSGSHKNRTIKASSHKSRPRLIATVSQGSHLSDFDLMSQQMDGYLLQDDARSVASSTMYYPTLSSVGLPMDSLSGDGISYSPTLLQQHVDPLQMQLKFDPSVAGNSPIAAWSPPSPVSRNSSPDMPEDMWSNSIPMDASPTHTNNSSPIMDGTSPSLDRQMGLMTTEDPNGLMTADDMFALPPSYTRRSSGDGESSARIHPLYKTANPASDGLFHCPWEGTASCNHKPEKLKCNYDKFVDSHLKPYRCKIEACENAKFSSTACLLRHEREAHAMHGHGDKPYLCHYEGCERSIIGSGFPRQWNLRDHMRRVHNDNGSSLTNGSSPTGLGSSSQTSKGRKRKSKDSGEPSSSIRKQSSKSAQAAEAAAAARAAAEQPLNEEWFRHHKALQDFVQGYSAPDAFDYIQGENTVSEHLESMFKISKKLKHRRSHRHHSS
ncbi:hypothetical protein F5Y16DRAFT_396338 [Xylariaceae sp. FL0255]|nr:hypothetical protein F5Y16DRAFT_396338 [Xylariaceae sp. FL0255]